MKQTETEPGEGELEGETRKKEDGKATTNDFDDPYLQRLIYQPVTEEAERVPVIQGREMAQVPPLPQAFAQAPPSAVVEGGSGRRSSLLQKANGGSVYISEAARKKAESFFGSSSTGSTSEQQIRR